MFGLSYFVEAMIGKFYLESPSVSVGSLFADSDNKTPIIFVLSQGADPTNSILNYAHESENENNLGIISLGQGQGQAASDLIDDSKVKGKWVLLQNCHLAKTFMEPLELILEAIIESSEVHEDFRLLLTSMPADYFPISVLQNGIKLTTEPPRGIKANLKRCFNEIQEGYLDGCNKDPKHFHKLVWGLTFFHAIIQERKKFGPLGWNKIYEFNDSDLATSKTVLQMLINEQDDIPWEALNYVIGQINYGGRVTDDLDRHCLLSILQRFFNQGIQEEKFQFCDSDVYYIPELGTLEEYRQYVEGLPLVDDPEVFGMHENANINFQMQESEKIVRTILSIQPRIGTKSDAELTEDQIVLQLIDNLTPEVPKTLDRTRGVKELFEKQHETGLIPSLSTVLLQEIDRYNILLRCIKQTLTSLKRAISGFVIMSNELDQMYGSLLNNKVPELWENVGYASLKPLAGWIKDLGARVNFLNDWLMNGNPIQYWISGFFFPQGFLTGVLQTHSRKHLIAIDELAFTFKFYDPMKEQVITPFDGVNVYGLYLEGASFDRRKRYLIDQQPGEMFYVMPTIYFNPVEKHEPNPEEYQCPVYKTSVRAGVLSTTGQSTNFILMIEVPAGDFPPDFWTLRGTALLTQLNE